MCIRNDLKLFFLCIRNDPKLMCVRNDKENYSRPDFVVERIYPGLLARIFLCQKSVS